MGMFDRFATMVRSNLNDLISRAENPEKMLNQLIVDMRSQLDKARQQVAQSIADEKKLEADSLAMKKQAEDWERRAMLAVQEGRDDLAKQALMRYNEALQGAQQLHDTWVKSKTETEALKASLRQLNDKIEEAKRKKNILIARARRAEAQQRIQETLSGMGDKSAFESFERMQEKIEANERKAIASAELNEEMTGDSLAKQFEQLEYHGSSDQQLLELKAKMGMIGGAKETPKQIGQGRRAGRRCTRGAAQVVKEPRYLILADHDFGIDDVEDRQLRSSAITPPGWWRSSTAHWSARHRSRCSVSAATFRWSASVRRRARPRRQLRADRHCAAGRTASGRVARLAASRRSTAAATS